MKNLNSIIGGLSKSGLLSGFAGGMAGGALTSAVTSKKGRKMGKSALKLGALAAVGGVAWKAYQAYSNKQTQQAQSTQQNVHHQEYQPAQQPAASTYTPSSQQRQASLTYSPATLSQRQFEAVVEDESANAGQMLLLRAMITAANADGHIDGDERERIYQQVEQLELSVQDKAGLFDELRNPMSLDALVGAVPNSETAVEVYAASLLAIDQGQQESVGYLNRLASSLMIPRELVSALHEQASMQ